MRVGLEGLAFAVPQNYLLLSDLAQARGVDPAKFTVGLGQIEMAVPTPCEDTVTLATEAAQNLLTSFDVDPSSIGLLITGTETGVDQSKPVGSYVHDLLGLAPTCRVFETKHACYGAMAGLSMAVNWILSGRARGKKALVIASDIARYGLRSAGEPTQGAGAVALLVSDAPRLLEINSEIEGYFAKQVMDFWRPNYSKDAMVDGHYSMACYLEALEGAFAPFIGPAASARIEDRFAACLYHAPFVKMAQKAHQKLHELQAGAAFEKGSDGEARARADYQVRVAPWLELNARVGNVYTGALFLSLTNYLEDAGDRDAGREISLFSYGSGCMAEFMSARVLDGAGRWLSRQPFREVLARRTRVSVARYEEILTANDRAETLPGLCAREAWQLDKQVVYNGTHEHRRLYLRGDRVVIS